MAMVSRADPSLMLVVGLQHGVASDIERYGSDEIKSAFRFNDAVLRALVVSRKEAIPNASPMARQREERDDNDRRDRRRPAGDS